MRKIFSKITGLLGSIPQDKLLHFIAGLLIVAVCSLCSVFAPYAWSVAALAGFGKECYDSLHHGEVDVWDFAATTAGALTMQMAVWLYLIIW